MERGDQIVNNLSAISGLMRHEGRFTFSAELQEAIHYIRELEEKLSLIKIQHLMLLKEG